MSESEKGGGRTVPVTRRGIDLIRDPLINKGTAFSAREREELHLHGLLPVEINSMDNQESRTYASIAAIDDPLTKYVALSDLQDRNEHLYYRILTDHIEELMPIVYTPTVGLATQNFSRVYRRGRGLWITPDFRGRIADVLAKATAGREIQLIVVTDNESILGIGDQGAGGMAISVGKLALYTAGAGIAPHHTLPISLDVGTNNPSLLEDPLYLGWRHERIRGEEYDSLLAEFVEAVRTVFPGVLLQWEDFRKDNALHLLERHRDDVLSFNDDIQGTGAVALAGLLAAARITGVPLAEQRVLIHGAGAAGMGISAQIVSALVAEGLAPEAARERVGVLDSRGLLVDDRALGDAYKQELAWTAATAAGLGLTDASDRGLARVVEAFRPTVLIGSSGQAGAFDEQVVRTMAAGVERPVIMPFSNPTSNAEARPEAVFRWTEGRALVATGSPFAPVDYEGRTIHVGQGNNVFVFPGLGLGALEAKAVRITDGMVTASSHALAQAVTAEELECGLLYPSVTRLREVSKDVALAVLRQAEADGVARVDVAAVAEHVESDMWNPVYPDYVPA